MKIKRKANTTSKFLCVIAGVVFLSLIGATICATVSSVTFLFSSEPGDITTYACAQEIVVNNDTDTNPIAFASSETNHKVSISYSVGYDFDIRLSYTLTWSDSTLSTANIILNYADRDSFIVDSTITNDDSGYSTSGYIYYTGGEIEGDGGSTTPAYGVISAGTGTLTIFTGVDFTDPDDDTYLGATLTIEVSVEIYKAYQTAYSTSHPLYADSVAGMAWLIFKNTCDSSTTQLDDYNLDSSTGTYTGDAYIIVYNPRGTQDYGISHPGVAGAYNKSTANGVWLGGNKYYSGLGLYIITGDSAFTIKVRARGSWVGTGSGTSYDNNILYNYTSDFTFLGYASTDYVFPYYTYKYSIPAHSTVYIPITDSIEISNAGMTSSVTASSYSEFTLVSMLEVNDVLFQDNALSAQVLSSASLSGLSTYTESEITVNNTTLYNAGLYNYTSGESQSFVGKISLTNNTDSDVTVGVSYTLYYYINNTNSTLNDGSGNHATSYDSSYWYRLEGSGAYFSSTGLTTSINIAAYSTVNIATYFATISGLKSAISSYSSDCWVVLVPTISITSKDADLKGSSVGSGAVLELSVSGTEATLSVKNNTGYQLTGITASATLQAMFYSYYQVSSEPNDWAYDYWNYYLYSAGVYTANTGTIFSANVVYSRSFSYSTTTITSYTLYNGFGVSGSGAYTFTSSSLVLQPGESALILTGTISSAGGTTNEVYAGYVTLGTGSAYGSSSSSSSVDLVNEGSSNPYLVNNSTTAYYVRFAGSVEDTSFFTTGSYIYYIGIIHAGEIVSAPIVNSSVMISVDYVEATDTYTSDTLSSWESSAVAVFDAYFEVT